MSSRWPTQPPLSKRGQRLFNKAARIAISALVKDEASKPNPPVLGCASCWSGAPAAAKSASPPRIR